MARVYPPLLDPDTTSSAERALYEAFLNELSDDWVVLHSVKWIANDDYRKPQDGESDFIVAHPKHGILVVEVKGGQIRFDAHTGRFSSIDRFGNDHDIKDPFEQAAVSKHKLIAKLRASKGWPQHLINLGHCVILPDTKVTGPVRPNAPRDIIIDASELGSLETRLRDTLSYWSGNDARVSPPGPHAVETMVRVLYQANYIQHPLIAEGARNDERALVRLTDQQSRYLRFLGGQRRAAIAGCAGSGKTFLAVEKARQLASEGMKVLFSCYNRPLADHLGNDLGYREQFDVFNFHQLCLHWVRQSSQHLSGHEGSDPDFFTTTLPNALLAAVNEIGPQYDAIIVDEGQDFRTEWWDALPWLLHDPSNGILYVFFDDNQRVYRDRGTIPIEQAPYCLLENCRNTQRIFNVVNSFYKGSSEITAIGPDGLPIEIVEYTSYDEAERKLRKTLNKLINEFRFNRDEIAVLSALGAERSKLLGLRVGNFELVDKLSLAENEVFATTVRRFKGLERSAIILCDIDGRISTDQMDELMYVGTSRAKTYLVLLMGKSAPSYIIEKVALWKS